MPGRKANFCRTLATLGALRAHYGGESWPTNLSAGKGARISYEDIAVALIDEVESPRQSRRDFASLTKCGTSCVTCHLLSQRASRSDHWYSKRAREAGGIVGASASKAFPGVRLVRILRAPT
jgi:hypothetical protein